MTADNESAILEFLDSHGNRLRDPYAIGLFVEREFNFNQRREIPHQEIHDLVRRWYGNHKLKVEKY